MLHLVAETLNISPPTYRMPRKSKVAVLSSERLIRKLLPKAFQDNNLENMFLKSNPEQRLVNILFDKVKLTHSFPMHPFSIPWKHFYDFSSGFEVICHHGGPECILRIIQWLVSIENSWKIAWRKLIKKSGERRC